MPGRSPLSPDYDGSYVTFGEYGTSGNRVKTVQNGTTHREKVEAFLTEKRKPYFHGDPSDNLLKAVGDWVASKGGSVVVAGGIETQKWPGELEYTFRVAIKCTGRMPIAEKTS